MMFPAQKRLARNGISFLTCGSRPRYRRMLLPTRYSEARLVPDLDVIGFRFGVRYGDFWGHRGFTHSLLFAALLTSLVVLVGFRQGVPALGRFALWGYLFLATASHAFLDAMTDGGLGVAFFSPFNNTRYFLHWRPIRVSPIGITRFFSSRGLEVVESELL